MSYVVGSAAPDRGTEATYYLYERLSGCRARAVGVSSLLLKVWDQAPGTNDAVNHGNAACCGLMPNRKDEELPWADIIALPPTLAFAATAARRARSEVRMRTATRVSECLSCHI
jgi:hypothetical protein